MGTWHTDIFPFRCHLRFSHTRQEGGLTPQHSVRAHPIENLGFSFVESRASSASRMPWRDRSRVGSRRGTTYGIHWLWSWNHPWNRLVLQLFLGRFRRRLLGGSKGGSSGRNRPPGPPQTTTYLLIQRGHSPTPTSNTNRSRGSRNRPGPTGNPTGHHLLGFYRGGRNRLVNLDTSTRGGKKHKTNPSWTSSNAPVAGPFAHPKPVLSVCFLLCFLLRSCKIRPGYSENIGGDVCCPPCRTLSPALAAPGLDRKFRQAWQRIFASTFNS